MHCLHWLDEYAGLLLMFVSETRAEEAKAIDILAFWTGGKEERVALMLVARRFQERQFYPLAKSTTTIPAVPNSSSS